MTSRKSCLNLVTFMLLGLFSSSVMTQPLNGQDANNQNASGAGQAAAEGEQSETVRVPAEPGTAQAGSTKSAESADDAAAAKTGGASTPNRYPLLVLAIGIAIVLGLIVGFKVNAFIALITAAIAVSLLADGDVTSKISRVATAFGSSAGGIGIVIALAAVIGTCMLDSGAADRIVRAFLRFFGEKRSPIALMGSGFVLAVPVFFDTVFYLLVPLARSLHRKTGKHYLKYLLAIGAGGAITHTLVPPTPGPLLMAANLGIDVGWMIMIGAAVALPAAIAGLVASSILDKLMPVPMRQVGSEPDPEPLSDEELPSLGLSLLPVVLPVLLISTSTILSTLADAEQRARLSRTDIEANDWANWRADVVADAAANPDSPGGRLLQHPAITDETRALFASSTPLSESDRDAIIANMNGMLSDKGYYSEKAFFGTHLNDTAKSMLPKLGLRMKPADAARLNRSLLESKFPQIKPHLWETPMRKASNYSAMVGNANLALLISTVIAMWMLVKQRNLSRADTASVVEKSLMSGGVIILITAGGGAFGAMLQVAHVGDAIRELFAGAGDNAQMGGIAVLLLGCMIASVLKVAQGSSTVAMITASGMVATFAAPETLGFNPVYLACAIGAGSLIGSWMNDSGFWIFAKMGGLTEVEALKSWTVILCVLGVVSLIVTIALSQVLPLYTPVG